MNNHILKKEGIADAVKALGKDTRSTSLSKTREASSSSRSPAKAPQPRR